MLLPVLSGEDMVGTLAAFDAIAHERQQGCVLLLWRTEKRTNVPIATERRTGKVDRCSRRLHNTFLLSDSRDKFGGGRTLALARQSRGNTKTHQTGLVQSSIRKYVGRLDVFVDETTSVRLAECCSEPNRTAKKLFQLHWPSKKSIEWLSV